MQNLLVKNLKQAYQELLKLSDIRAKKYAEQLHESIEQLESPPWVLISGETNAGKSHLLNQLIPEIELPTENMPATALCTVIQYGETLKTFAVSNRGQKKQMSLSEINDYVLQSKRETASANDLRSVDHIRIEVPNPILKQVTLIDTPGLNSTNAAHTAATERFYPKAHGAIWVFSGSSGVNSSTENRDIQKLRAFDIDVLGVVNKMAVPIEASYDDDPDRFGDLDYAQVQEILISEWKKRYEEVGLIDLIGIDSKLAKQAKVREQGNFDWEDSNYELLIQKVTSFTMPKSIQEDIRKKLFNRISDIANETTDVQFIAALLQQFNLFEKYEARFTYIEKMQELLAFGCKADSYKGGLTNFMKVFNDKRKQFIKKYTSFDIKERETAIELCAQFLQELKRIEKIEASGQNILAQRTEMPIYEASIVELYRDASAIMLRTNGKIQQAYEQFVKRCNEQFEKIVQDVKKQIVQMEETKEMVEKEAAIVNQINTISERLNIFITSIKESNITKFKPRFSISEEKLNQFESVQQKVKQIAMIDYLLELQVDEHAPIKKTNEWVTKVSSELKVTPRIQQSSPDFTRLNDEREIIEADFAQVEQDANRIVRKHSLSQFVELLIEDGYLGLSDSVVLFVDCYELQQRFLAKIAEYNRLANATNTFADETIRPQRFKKVQLKDRENYLALKHQAEKMQPTAEDIEAYAFAIEKLDELLPQVIQDVVDYFEGTTQYYEQQRKHFNNKIEGRSYFMKTGFDHVKNDLAQIEMAIKFAVSNKLPIATGMLREFEQYRKQMSNLNEQLEKLKFHAQAKTFDFTPLYQNSALKEELVPYDKLEQVEIKNVSFIRPLTPILSAATIAMLIWAGVSFI